MNTNLNARTAGAMLLLAIVAGVLCIPFSGAANEPDYLTRMAENETRVIIGALLQMLMGFACAGIALWLYPVLKQHNHGLALAAVCFRTIEAAMFIISATGLLVLLSLSQSYVRAGVPDAAHFETLGMVVHAAHHWLGSTSGAIAFCLGALMYYAVFYQSRLIPRWLSIWGVLAIVSHLISVVLVLFGRDPFSTITIVMNLPIFLNELALAGWLLVKGVSPVNPKGA